MWISVFLGQAKKIQMTEFLTNFPLDNNHSKHLYFTFLITFLVMNFIIRLNLPHLKLMRNAILQKLMWYSCP